MSDVAILTENLGKQFRIGAREKYKALRDTLTDLMRAPVRMAARLMGGPPEPEDARTQLWALRDFTTTFHRGEVVGIIGPNGAGKTTLLKLLSRITAPTEGRAVVRGRVGSLLEVGTGFHPELTGRENIFLNGAILGMRRAEIRAKFDEIVAFAENEKFLDTPVKRYSSGMYGRLAFAVAAHLESEILMVDEVLAVGDAAFQKRCIERMGNVASAGRAVLVVSHNMASIRQLCRRSILISAGKLVLAGPTDDVLHAYTTGFRGARIDCTQNMADRRNRSSLAVQFRSIQAEDVSGVERWTFRIGDTVRFRITYEVVQPVIGLSVYLGVHAGAASDLITSVKEVVTGDPLAIGMRGTITVDLLDVALRPGEFYLYFQLRSLSGVDLDVIEFRNLSIPPIAISADDGETDIQRTGGFLTVPHRVTHTPG